MSAACLTCVFTLRAVSRQVRIPFLSRATQCTPENTYKSVTLRSEQGLHQNQSLLRHTTTIQTCVRNPPWALPSDLAVDVLLLPSQTSSLTIFSYKTHSRRKSLVSCGVI